MKVPNERLPTAWTFLSLSRLQNEGSQLVWAGFGGGVKSIKATE